MRSQLFIRLPKNHANDIYNPNFTLGLTGWNAVSATTSNNICYLSGGTIYQNNIINASGNYKLTLNVSAPIDGSNITGNTYISLGGWNTTITTIGQHSFYFYGNITYLTILYFEGQNGWNGGITNIQIQSEEFYTEEIDLYDDVFIPMTYNIADIQDITKRNASFSKTITIPGTGHNNSLINHIYNISSSGVDTMNSPVFCFLLQDSYKIFEGTLELLKCNLDNIKDVSYEVIIYSQTRDLYTKIGNKTLRENVDMIDDLDFSEYNHIMTLNTIIDRQNDPVGSNVVYVPIDKQCRDWEPWARTWKTDEFTPSLYIKEIWDKIFEKAGFTYTSTFLTSDFFKHLIYPHSDRWLRCTDAWAASKSAEVSNGPGLSLEVHPLTSPDFYDSRYIDGGDWDITTNGSMLPFDDDNMSPNFGMFVCKESGYYDISLNFNYDYYFYVPSFSSIPSWNMEGRGSSYSPAFFQVVNKLLIKRYSGVEEDLRQTSQTMSETYIVQLPMQYSMSEISNDNLSYNGNVFLSVGDRVCLRQYIKMATTTINPLFWMWVGPGNQDLVVQMVVNSSSVDNYLKVIATTQVTENMLVQPTNILHKDIKQADFITSIVKMFNLYMEPISDTNFIIEPRDDYYALGTDIHDWTYKVSTNNTIVIEQPTDIIKSIIDFKYDYDEDYYSKAYKEANFQREYGEYYKKEPKNIDDSIKYGITLIFAPAPNAPMCPGSKMEIPKLYKLSDDLTYDQAAEFKPRILYYKGTVNTYTPTGSQPEIFRYSNQLGTQHLDVIGMFSYCGHFDNIYGYEQNDLLFGTNNWYWEITNPNWVTWNNLFNKYYYNMVQEYIDIDTRIVTMFINLLPTDMENLRFYDLIYIDGIYYRLNKIFDYVPGGLTKVELLKIKKQDIPAGGFVNPLPIYTNPPTTIIRQINPDINNYIDVIFDEEGINEDLLIDILDGNEYVSNTASTYLNLYGGSYIEKVEGNDIDGSNFLDIFTIKLNMTSESTIINNIGGSGTTTTYENRHDWVSPYDYCGIAVSGSSETVAVWTITRITVASDGSTTSTTLTNVKWSERYIIF